MEDVRITLFGTACTIAAGYIERDVLNILTAYSNANNLALENVLFDYRNLLWLDLPGIRKWQDFGIAFFVNGLYDSPYSFIEIKMPNKKRAKINLGDVYFQRSLFPIYDKSIEHIVLSKNTTEKPLLIIAETTIGKTGTATIKTNTFDIDQIKFIFTHVKLNEKIEYRILKTITYNDKEIAFKKPDVLVNGFYSIIIQKNIG